MVITCLHGFLGNPRDWDFLRDAGFTIETPPLDAIPPRGARTVRTPRREIAIFRTASETILGYSLGGRLALHALLAGADYKRAIFVSTGLGIEGEEARVARRASDEVWARRFETEDFDAVMSDWNAQPVLSGPSLSRSRDDYDPRALREWSSAVLPPVTSRLNELAIPTLWIAGARDVKYVAEAKKAASLVADGWVAIVEGAGHRVPWERSDEFVALLRT